MLVLGIDPGKSGAAVLVDHTRSVVEVRRDFKDLQDIVRGCYDLAREANYTVIELVGAMPGQGVVSMFHFGEAYGAAKSALYCCGVGLNDRPLEIVPPVKWQNWARARFGVPRPLEFDSRAIASRLMTPDEVRNFLGRKKDHNTADAYLLAVYGLVASGAWTLPS